MTPKIYGAACFSGLTIFLMYIFPFLTVPQIMYPLSQLSFGLLPVFDIAQNVIVEIPKDSFIQQFTFHFYRWLQFSESALSVKKKVTHLQAVYNSSIIPHPPNTWYCQKLIFFANIMSIRLWLHCGFTLQF